LAVKDFIILTYSSGTLIILLREDMKMKARLERTKVTNRLVAFDDHNVMLAGDDSLVSFLNLDTMTFFGTLKVEFSEAIEGDCDIYDIQP
jgi:hypothetical protein